MAWFILGIYGLALSFVLVYSFIQIHLVFLYLKNKNKVDPKLPVLKESEWPMITIQLPLYNELYVAKRLIQNIALIDYPKDKLEIQVLDDSNDETTGIIRKTIENLGGEGEHFKLIRRKNRVGYKAGALKYGMEQMKGELVAIFDADFLPKPDFLKLTVPYLVKNKKIGVVQTRWGHINKDYNLLTKCQAFGLDAHFVVEQCGRNSGGHFINFNGTGGVWRKSCIEDAGNWEADTLTEDLDLSYRAQLKGWKFKYLENIIAPAELPITMNALKSQQFRWTKGAAENTIKNLSRVLKSDLPFSTKVHSFFHLMNSAIFLCILICSFLSVPILLIKVNHSEFNLLFKLAGIFIISLMFLIVFYGVSYFKDRKFSVFTFLRFLIAFSVFLAMSMGLGIHNTIAVIEGLMGKKSPFVRTPKFNITEQNDNWTKNIYRMKNISILTYLEGASSLYFLFGIILSIHLNDYTMIYLETILFLGYFGVFFYSVKHSTTN
jgi:cellulose synthase/poly-beta-1,6-N-acetylglucosamine synthase-like glycosyltransferase